MPTTQQESDVLQRFGHDLTTLAEAGHFQPLSGYDPWVNRVIEVLANPRHPRFRRNPVLVGLTAGEGWPIIAEVVRRMASGETPDILSGRRVVALDWEAIGRDISDLEQLSRSLQAPEPDDLAADDQEALYDSLTDEALCELFERDLHTVGEWRRANPLFRRLELVFDAVRDSKMQVFLYVEHLHRLFGGDMERYPVDMRTLLKPLLARDEVRILGACGLDEYRQYIEADAAMQCRFHEVCSSPNLMGYLGHNGA